MPLAALGVHQARYYLVFGAHTPARLLRDGHSYLGSLIPFAVLGAALALGVLAGRLARAWQGVGADGRSRSRAPHSMVRIWMLVSVVLLSPVLRAGTHRGRARRRPRRRTGRGRGSGGWLAVPLAIGVGGVLTLVLRAGDALVELITGLRVRRRPGGAPLPMRFPAGGRRTDWRLAGGSGVAAGRAPPLALGSR